MSFAERARICVTNAAAISMAFFGPLFAASNVLNERLSLVPFNVLVTVSGLGGLALSGLRRPSAAFTVVTVGASIAFIVVGWLYRNGVENYLLTLMAAAVLFIEARRLRWSLLALYGVAFFVVKQSHFAGYEHADGSRVLFTANLAIFLVGFVSLLELFRRLNADYLARLVHRGEDLDERQEELLREHDLLISRTAELQIANRFKERLLAVIGHDLRGPVGSLQQTLELFDEGEISEDDLRKLLRELRIETANVHECLEALVVWGETTLRDRAPEIRDRPLREDAASAVRLHLPLAESKNVVIENRIPPGTIVRADSERLRVVLRNLISNAVKYSPAGGRVIVGAVEDGNSCRVVVTDCGVGMSEELIRNVLQGRVRASQPGTADESGIGIGLELSREFLRDLGSGLEVSSRVGEGTTMSFVLPGAHTAGLAVEGQVC